MSLTTEDHATSSSEDETLLTPSTESLASCDGTEPNWLFHGSLPGQSGHDYSPHSAPALAMHHGRLWCLWAGKSHHESPLFWTSSDSHGNWNEAQEMVIPWRVRNRALNAVGALAVADLNGILHLVFLERTEDSKLWETPPNSRHTLVHLQYDDQCQTWGKRAIFGVNSGPHISLKGHGGQLYCVYTDPDQELCYSIWSETTGWSHSETVGNMQCTNGSFALYTSGSGMHLLYAGGKAEEEHIQDFEYDDFACCWCHLQSPSRVMGPFLGGFDVASSEAGAHIVYQDSARRPVLMSTSSKDRCAVAEEVHGKASWKVPAIAIVHGTLVCVWVGGPNSHRELMWSQRLTTSSISMQKWMSRIDSDLYISELSIPGSHETCATIAVPWVQCQHMSIDDQLKSGIRYFDFRCGLSFGGLYLFHGNSPLGFALRDVLERMYAWLEQMEKEALMVQIKMEGGTGDEVTFEAMLRSEITNNQKFWALGNTIPTLGAIRGKIQLVRRFHISSGILGIDVRRWADNSPKFTIPLKQHESVVVQDRYEYTDVFPTFAELIETKSSAVDALITSARGDKNPRAWFLNWTNAYALPFSFSVIATPADIAIGRNEVVGRHREFVPGVNASLLKKSFQTPVKGRFGTILLDFAETPSPDLVAAIVKTNPFQME